MKLNRSGFYKWKARLGTKNIHQENREILSFLIKDWHSRYPSYGYHDIAAVIRKDAILDFKFSDNLIHKCCKHLQVQSQAKHYQFYKPKGESHIFPNKVQGKWNATKPLEIIVSDMTHLKNQGKTYEWTYMVDTYNNEIISSYISNRAGDPRPYYACLKSLMKMIIAEKKTDPVLLHTDQGAVYHSKAFRKTHENYNIERSMSRAGTPTDNPIIESLNGWIKAEMACDYKYWEVADIEKFLEEYVYYFNNERPAFCLNYKTPIQYKLDEGF